MADRFIIEGNNGKRTLSGSISIKGAKNAALKALAASILFKDSLRLENVPDIEDVKRMNDILKEGGASVIQTKAEEYEISVPQSFKTQLSSEIAKQLRASIVFSGPMLARFGKVSFPHPGGCVIGERSIDFFIEGFKKMGAEVSHTEKEYTLTTKGKKLRGADIFFKKPSVTATETLMMAAVLASGKTVIKNAAREPEIGILADFLNECGARIKGAGESTIEINGGGLLQAKKKAFSMPPDRIETGSFLILAILAGKKIEIKNCNPLHIEILVETLRGMGAVIEVHKNSIKIQGDAQPKEFRSTNIETREYPGFPTDLQAPMTVFLTQSTGQALVFETIFSGRLAYVQELVRMGAYIDACDPHRVIVRGPTELKGREMESPDLRAGLAFMIAAIVANGTSVIHTVYNIDRGYERIEERLKSIGVDIKRI